jgi:hypothetical protein
MRKYLYLVALVALATLVFAPAALAQRMGDDNMMNDDKMMGDDNMMSSASSSASAMSSASSSASAMSSPSASASAMMSPSASASAMSSPSASATASALPGTGGPPLLTLISAAALVLILGSGLLAATVVRRNS